MLWLATGLFLVLIFILIRGTDRIPGVHEPGYWSPIDGVPPPLGEEIIDDDGPWFVNCHMIDRAYGGPEEGGWYFTYGVLEFSIECKSEARQRAVYLTLLDWVIEMNEGRPDIGQTNSDGVYSLTKDDQAGRNFPEERPHYE